MSCICVMVLCGIDINIGHNTHTFQPDLFIPTTDYLHFIPLSLIMTLATNFSLVLAMLKGAIDFYYFISLWLTVKNHNSKQTPVCGGCSSDVRSKIMPSACPSIDPEGLFIWLGLDSRLGRPDFKDSLQSALCLGHTERVKVTTILLTYNSPSTLTGISEKNKMSFSSLFYTWNSKSSYAQILLARTETPKNNFVCCVPHGFNPFRTLGAGRRQRSTRP